MSGLSSTAERGGSTAKGVECFLWGDLDVECLLDDACVLSRANLGESVRGERSGDEVGLGE